MAIDRTRQQKRKATQAVLKRLLAACVISVLILSSLYLYNYLTTVEWLAVDEILLEGVCRGDQKDLGRLLNDINGQNILLLSLESYIQRIESHPRVKNASLKRILPNRVVCSIEEREPVALIFAGRFLEVDEYGMVLGEDNLTPVLDLPIITGISNDVVPAGKICRDQRLRNVLDALEYCKQFGGSFAEDISEMRVGRGGVTIFSLKENTTLLLGDTNLKKRLEKYFLLKNSITNEERSAKLIDLRFDGQVVLRNKL